MSSTVTTIILITITTMASGFSATVTTIILITITTMASGFSACQGGRTGG